MDIEKLVAEVIARALAECRPRQDVAVDVINERWKELSLADKHRIAVSGVISLAGSQAARERAAAARSNLDPWTYDAHSPAANVFKRFRYLEDIIVTNRGNVPTPLNNLTLDDVAAGAEECAAVRERANRQGTWYRTAERVMGSETVTVVNQLSEDARLELNTLARTAWGDADI